MIRQPVVAGMFYPGPAAQLRSMIEKFVEKDALKEEVVGLIAPHAGYVYSGPVAGAAISCVKFKDTFIILGPNHTGLGQPFSIMTQGVWQTPLGDVQIDSELASKILASSQYLADDPTAHSQEHSIEVQLPFLQYFKPDVKIVPIVLSPGPGTAYEAIGREIAHAVKDLKREVVLMASSDMTHYEPDKEARRKDNKAIEAILELNADELLERVDKFGISMCGYAPAVAVITAARELGATGARLVKYQTSGDTSGDYASVVGYAGIILTAMSPIVKLAKETVETYVKQGVPPDPPSEPTPEMLEKAGTFVSIHKLGELRGCIGTFQPQSGNVAEEIIENAVSAATRDPRFPPVTAEELDYLDYSVDVLTSPEKVDSKEQLDPKKYGVIVECGWRRGLLLPDLEGVENVDHQIDICCQKAGISPKEKVNLYRFEVKRYK